VNVGRYGLKLRIIMTKLSVPRSGCLDAIRTVERGLGAFALGLQGGGALNVADLDDANPRSIDISASDDHHLNAPPFCMFHNCINGRSLYGRLWREADIRCGRDFEKCHEQTWPSGSRMFGLRFSDYVRQFANAQNARHRFMLQSKTWSAIPVLTWLSVFSRRCVDPGSQGHYAPLFGLWLLDRFPDVHAG
jgi:hypothetical protein